LDHLFPNFLVFRACGPHLASGKGADCLDCHYYMFHRSCGQKRTEGHPIKSSQGTCVPVSVLAERSALSTQYSVLPPRSLSEVTLNGRSNLTTCVKNHSCAIFSPETEMRKISDSENCRDQAVYESMSCFTRNYRTVADSGVQPSWSSSGS